MPTKIKVKRSFSFKNFNKNETKVVRVLQDVQFEFD